MFGFRTLRMPRKFLLLCLGLGLIGAAQLIPRGAFITAGELLSHESILLADYQAEQVSWERFTARSLRIVGTVEIALNVIYRSSVPVNDGFTVTARADVKNIDCKLVSPTPSQLPGDDGGSLEENKRMEDAYETRIRQFFDSRPLLFHLHLAGATIAPSETQRPDRDSVTWSVVAARDNIRSFNGHIELSLPADSGVGRFSFKNRSAPVLVAVEDAIFTLPNVLRWAGSFFGSLLTLPGILSFVENYKEKKKRRKRRRQTLES